MMFYHVLPTFPAVFCFEVYIVLRLPQIMSPRNPKRCTCHAESSSCPQSKMTTVSRNKTLTLYHKFTKYCATKDDHIGQESKRHASKRCLCLRGHSSDRVLLHSEWGRSHPHSITPAKRTPNEDQDASHRQSISCSANFLQNLWFQEDDKTERSNGVATGFLYSC